MFDIAFSELMLIAIVALLVIGPEQLPKVARTAGRWFGKMRQFVRTVQQDIEREIRAEDLKRIVDEQARSSGVYEILETTKEAGEELKGAVAEVESLQAGSARLPGGKSDMNAADSDDSDASPAQEPPIQDDSKNDTRHG